MFKNQFECYMKSVFALCANDKSDYQYLDMTHYVGLHTILVDLYTPTFFYTIFFQFYFFKVIEFKLWFKIQNFHHPYPVSNQHTYDTIV